MRLHYIPKGSQSFFGRAAVPVVFDTSGCATFGSVLDQDITPIECTGRTRREKGESDITTVCPCTHSAHTLETIGIIQIWSNKCCTSCKSLGAVFGSLQRIAGLVDFVSQPFVELCQARDVISFILFHPFSTLITDSTGQYSWCVLGN